MTLPAPIIEKVNGLFVVRDDKLPGGTKMRFILPYIQSRPEREFVYASPAVGYAQIAISHCCSMAGRQAVIFTAKRKTPFPLTLQAKEAGARVIMVPHGYLNVVQARAAKYAEQTGAHLVPFGVDIPEAMQYLIATAKALPVKPKEVWTCAGSGTLTRALQKAWPTAKFYAVMIGKKDSDIGRAVRIVAPEKFEQPSKTAPPFKSSPYYDAKAWRFAMRQASPGALFWNVA